MKRTIFVSLILLVAFISVETAKAQEGSITSDNMTYDRQTIRERTVIPYHHLREADVMYVRRVERIMDSREKQNLAIRWPRNAFHEIIYLAAINGDITVYENDSLTSAYEPQEVFDRGGYEELIHFQPDPINDPYYVIDSVIVNELRPADIVRFRIMEEWVFDKQRSMFFPRIVAIAPLFNMMAEGEVLGEAVLFWAKWSDLRELLINETMFNRHNDAMRLSYADFFEHRLFSSYIIKEPNEFDLRVIEFQEYQGDPFAALLESERIRHELMFFEHDLWQY